MPKRPSPPEHDLDQIRRYCAGRVPPELTDRVRIEVEVRGSRVTIFERHPPWTPDQPDWSRLPTAQLRWDEEARCWSLYCADRNSRWQPFPAPAAPDVTILLDIIEADPTGIFWG